MPEVSTGHHSGQDPEGAEAAEVRGDDHVEDSVVDTGSGRQREGSATPGAVLGRHQQRRTAVDEGAVEVNLRLTARQAAERTADAEQIGVALPQRPGCLQGGYGDLGVGPVPAALMNGLPLAIPLSTNLLRPASIRSAAPSRSCLSMPSAWAKSSPEPAGTMPRTRRDPTQAEATS
jgi:hypothetical protein